MHALIRTSVDQSLLPFLRTVFIFIEQFHSTFSFCFWLFALRCEILAQESVVLIIRLHSYIQFHVRIIWRDRNRFGSFALNKRKFISSELLALNELLPEALLIYRRAGVQTHLGTGLIPSPPFLLFVLDRISQWLPPRAADSAPWGVPKTSLSSIITHSSRLSPRYDLI